MSDAAGSEVLREWVKAKVDYLVQRREFERQNNTQRAARRECARCKIQGWWFNELLTRMTGPGILDKTGPLPYPPMPRHTCHVSVLPPRHTCHQCSHQCADRVVRYCAPCKAAGRIVTYCDQECQLLHWRAAHKEWCENSQVQILASVGVDPDTRTHSCWTEEQLGKVAELTQENPSCEQVARRMRRLPSPSR